MQGLWSFGELVESRLTICRAYGVAILYYKEPSRIVLYMGGCQNYGSFLGPYYNTAPII